MNYYEMSRTNYFPVKDRGAFEEAVQAIDGIDLVWKDEQAALLFEDGVPMDCEDDDGNEVEFDLVNFVMPHLQDGYVCVLTGIGYEGMRYHTGFALAFNNAGEMVSIATGEIYNKAEQAGLGVISSEATY